MGDADCGSTMAAATGGRGKDAAASQLDESTGRSIWPWVKTPYPSEHPSPMHLSQNGTIGVAPRPFGYGLWKAMFQEGLENDVYHDSFPFRCSMAPLR